MAIPLLRHAGNGALAGLVLVAGLHAQEVTVIPLPAPQLDGTTSIERTLSERRSVRDFSARPLTLEAVAQLLWAAQGLSEPGAGLRTAPSAGARYPLETYLLAAAVNGLPAGLYRYRPADHALEEVQAGDPRRPLADAALRQSFIQDAPVTVVLTAVFPRTEGRYGARAARYVPMEVGAAAQNLALQAVALELGTVFVGAFQDQAVTRALDLPPRHAPMALLPVGYPRD
jgi:SagB-type dehydrogenase family enzyme